MPVYRVELLPSAERDVARLDPQLLARIAERIERLGEEPRPPGSMKLAGVELFRLRVGDHRVVYKIDDGAHAVFVHRVRHRRDVYRSLR